MIYVIGGTDHDWLLWKANHKTADAMQVRSVRTFQLMSFFPDDEVELTGTWWRRADIREVVHAAYYGALQVVPIPPRQIVATLRPLMEDWHRAVAKT